MKKIIVLFLILFMLIVLLSAFVSNWMPLQKDVYEIEGFTGKPATYMTFNVLSSYGENPIYNIYDNIYFDKKNGNLIIVNDTGDSTSDIKIFNRTNTSIAAFSSYSLRDSSDNILTQTTTESKVTTISGNATNPWTYKTPTYEITYIPFNNETYIHLMDISTQSPSIFLSAFFTDPTASNGGTQDYYLWTSSSSSATVGQSLNVTTGSYLCNSSPSDGTNVLESYYDTSAPVYQISEYVKYDTYNGNLLIQGTDSSGNKILTVYRRDGNTDEYTSTNNATTMGGSTPSSSLSSLSTNIIKPILANDYLQTNVIIYWPVMNNTIIAEYKGVLDSTNSGITLVSVTRFIGNALFGGIIKPDDTPRTQPSTRKDTPPSSAIDLPKEEEKVEEKTTPTDMYNMPPGMDNMMANYFKWFYYWNNMGGSMSDIQNTDKYILKTQIVPPVCPAQNCPSCNCASSSCVACQGASNVNTGSPPPPINDYNVLEDSIYGTGKLASDSIRGVGGFAKESIENTAGAVKSGVQYVGTGVGNFLGNLTRTNPTQVTYTGDNVGGYGNGGVGAGGVQYNGPGYKTTSSGLQYSPDVYSYGGALSPHNTSSSSYPDPLPVTADFSRFGR